MAKLSEDDKRHLTPAEVASLEGEGADAALAEFAGANDAAEAGNSAPGAELSDDEPADEPAQPDASVATEQAAEPPTLPQYTVDATDFAAQRAALRAERRAVEAKWASGELSDDDRATALDELQDKSDALLIEQTRASTLAEANAQAEQRAAESRANAETAAMRAVAEAAKASGQIDYASDIKAQKQFDVMFTAVKADPDNADKTATQLVQEAHKAVLALRGIVPTPARAASTAARDAPQTLRGLPNAAQGVVQDELIAQFTALSKDSRQQEKFMAGLTQQQMNKLVRWADSQVPGH